MASKQFSLYFLNLEYVLHEYTHFFTTLIEIRYNCARDSVESVQMHSTIAVIVIQIQSAGNWKQKRRARGT